jgi:hypothetical protein
MDSEQSEQNMTHRSLDGADTPGRGTSAYDPIEALLAATEQLSLNVQTLSNNITVQAKQSSRLRKIALALAGVIVLLVGVGYYAVNENHDNQVTNCENANESRAASRLLWNYILTFASRNNPDNPDIAKIQVWVNELYKDRDCSDLDREYKTPAPPDLSQRVGK